jgi:ribonucleoside-diphosphate reductase alpha chain
MVTRRVTDGKPCERKRRARCCAKSPKERTSAAILNAVRFTIHKWHTCKGTDRQNSTNPCSEYLFSTTRRAIASLNLMKFKRGRRFDIDDSAGTRFHHWQEIIVITRVTRSKRSPRTRIFSARLTWLCELGSLIMSYGFGYDSVEGRALAVRSPPL